MKIEAVALGNKKPGLCNRPSHSYGVHDSEKELSELVTIVCKDNQTVRYPRTKLASLSEYFRALLFGSFRENTQDSIKLEYVDSVTLKLLLGFYEQLEKTKNDRHSEQQFSRIFIKNVESAWELIAAADMLWMEKAASECDKYVVQTISLEKCPEICDLAQKYSRFYIMQEAVRKWVVGNRLFKNISPELQDRANENVELSKTCRRGCFKCKCNEVQGCMCAHMQLFDQKHTFYIIGGYYWEQFRDCYRISAHDLTKNRAEVRERTSAPSSGRSHDATPDNEFEAIEHYPGIHNEECSVVSLDTDIYVTGGFNLTAKAVKEVWKYETRTGEWRRVSDMRYERFYHCGFAVGEHIYICGGFNDNQVLKSLERYHPIYNEWIDLSDMLTGVGSAAHASDDTGLYVACGQYGHKEIMTSQNVQHYAIDSDQWSLLTTYESPVFFPQSEYGLSGIVADSKLYIVGGQTERCDAYDLHTKTWSRISDMHKKRMEAGVLAFDGKLYAFGGYDYRKGEHHDTVEEYNPEDNKWRLLPCRLPRPSRSLGICHIFDVERT